MKVPEDFIDNNHKLFVRFCKENNLYHNLKIRWPMYLSNKQNEVSFFKSWDHRHYVHCYKNAEVLIPNTYSKDEHMYFALVRLLNIMFIGCIDNKNSDEYQIPHEQLFNFACYIAPNLNKWRINKN